MGRLSIACPAPLNPRPSSPAPCRHDVRAVGSLPYTPPHVPHPARAGAARPPRRTGHFGWGRRTGARRRQRPAPADLIVHNASVYTVNAAQPHRRGDRRPRRPAGRWSAPTPRRSRCAARRRASSTRGGRAVDPRPPRRARPLHRARRQPAADRPARHDLVRRHRGEGAGARRDRSARASGFSAAAGTRTTGPTRAGRPARRSTARRPNNPVYLTRVDGHAALASRSALAAAKVTAATPDPDGRPADSRRARGRRPASSSIARWALVARLIPPPSPQQLDEQVLLADAECRRLGLTTVHDAGAQRRHRRRLQAPDRSRRSCRRAST